MKPSPDNDRVLSTLNRDGSRRWLEPRPMPGRFLRRRRIVAWLLIALFALLPFLRLDGLPLVLLDIPARRFVVFGRTFLPTDTLLLALLIVGLFLAVFLATALFGRVWCGWACPQTVYMEFLYRPIERFFHGTPGRRRRRWQGSPAAIAAKHAAFIVVSAFVAHTFLAYFVGVDRLWIWMRQSPLEHPAGFVVMLAVAGLMLFDFGFFREQTCILACPYGRFQSALLDRQSLIVSYDRRRGEPRGPMARTPRREATAAARGAALSLPVLAPAGAVATGDCVDCGMCVVCCPTGIDIRDGLQMECIGCAQCIDACDSVMGRIGRPTGLIRYSSQAAIDTGAVRLLRPRVFVYPLLLAAVAIAFAVALGRTMTFDLTVLRALGAPFVVRPDGAVANGIRVKIVNRSGATSTYAVSAEGIAGLLVEGGASRVRLEPGESRTIPLTVVAPADLVEATRGAAIAIAVTDEAGTRRTRPFHLQAPAARHGDRR